VSTRVEDELAFAGPGALAGLVRSRHVSARELVELSLRRVEKLDPQLNAFRIVTAEQAAVVADALTDFERPLAGVPIAIKDDLPVRGQAMTWGSRSYGPPQSEDAEPVRRLRAAGAIPIGITNVPELMIWPWTASLANGITRNPWEPSRTTGGSSGGSAAAVAAGLVPAATGSDGGGSIRIPSACCGLVGMKPTRGRVPAKGNWIGLSVYGALARTVADSALMLDVMAQPQGESFVQAAASEPGRLRIAASRKVPAGVLARLSDDQRRAWERVRDLLPQLGHHVEARDPAYGLKMLEFAQTWVRGIYEDTLQVPDRSVLERSTKGMATAGRVLVPPRRRAALTAHRSRTAAQLLQLWDDFDVLLTPALASTAIEAEGALDKPAPVAFDKASRFTPWTPIWNLTGQPAIAIPAGISDGGLPLSVQLIGRPNAEATLYSLAAQLEQAMPWADRRPPVS
jgi:amidase